MSTVKSPGERPRRIASCDPCRMSKLACDHAQPCSRCVRRGHPGKCSYRQNAFKRTSVNSLPRAPRTEKSSVSSGTPDVLSVPDDGDTNGMYTNSGFQGPSSLNTVLDTLREHTTAFAETSFDGQYASPDLQETGPGSPGTVSISASAVLKGAQLLDWLFSPTIGNTIVQIFDGWRERRWDTHVGAFVVPAVMETLKSIRESLQDAKSRQTLMLNLSERIFTSSKTPIQVHPRATLPDFLEQYAGTQLRWECIGVLLTLAGIIATEARAPNAIFASEPQRQALRRDIVRYGDLCVSFLEMTDVLNDIQIIFLYQTFQYQSVYYGDQSYKTWRRLNDATGALLAGGIHENSQDVTAVPSFLIEVRRRVFARMYAIDISLATFLGRPPRMSKRFSRTQLPLDVDLSDLVSGTYTSEQSVQFSTGHGWDLGGRMHTCTTIRWSMMTAMIREDTLELLLGNAPVNVEQRTCELRRDITEAWSNLPRFLTTIPMDLWASPMGGREIECLHQVRLLYLLTIFLIEWAAWRHGSEQPNLLLQSATDVLMWVNESLVHREQLPTLGFISLAWRVASCSLPAAGALSLYLLQSSVNASSNNLDAIFRRKTLEGLSVLIAHLDILHSPYDGNYKLFRQAKQSLQSVLDILLRQQQNADAVADAAAPTLGAPADDWMFTEYGVFNGGFWLNFPDCLYTPDEQMPLQPPS